MGAQLASASLRSSFTVPIRTILTPIWTILTPIRTILTPIRTILTPIFAILGNNTRRSVVLQPETYEEAEEAPIYPLLGPIASVYPLFTLHLPSCRSICLHLPPIYPPFALIDPTGHQLESSIVHGEVYYLVEQLGRKALIWAAVSHLFQSVMVTFQAPFSDYTVNAESERRRPIVH